MCATRKRIFIWLFALLIVLSITPHKAKKVKIKILKEAAAVEQAFTPKEINNIVEASKLSGVSPAWIAGMTKAESGGNCLSRAFNGPKIIKWGVARKFGEDLGALRRAGLTDKTIYSDHKGGDNSYFHRAYKIAPKTAVYVTAWGTNQVMGWELLRMGGISTKSPGGNPDQIVSAFFNDPCRISSLLIASWVNNSVGSWFRGTANRAARTGNFADFRRTTSKYLGKYSEGYTSRVMRYSKIFQQQNPQIMSQFDSGKLMTGDPLAAGPAISAAPGPAGTAAPRQTIGQDLEGQTIVLIGDSQTVGAMGRNLERTLNARGAKVIKLARGASSTKFWNDTLDGKKHYLHNKKPETRKYTLDFIKRQNPTQIIVNLGGNTAGNSQKYYDNSAIPLMQKLKSITPNVVWFGPAHNYRSIQTRTRSWCRKKGLSVQECREQSKQKRSSTDQILNQIAQQTGIRYVSMLEWAKSHEILRDKVQKIEDLRKDGHTKEANRLAKEIRGDGIHYKGMSAQYYAETVASNIGDYSGITGTGNVMIPGVTISRPATRKGKFVHGISPIEKFKFDTFYMELDMYFPEKGGAAGILSKHGLDYKFGREHQKAYDNLQKAKASGKAPTGKANQEKAKEIQKSLDTAIEAYNTAANDAGRKNAEKAIEKFRKQIQELGFEPGKIGAPIATTMPSTTPVPGVPGAVYKGVPTTPAPTTTTSPDAGEALPIVKECPPGTIRRGDTCYRIELKAPGLPIEHDPVTGEKLGPEHRTRQLAESADLQKIKIKILTKRQTI